MSKEMEIGLVSERFVRWSLLITYAIILAGCAQRPVKHAPIVERGTEMKKSVPPAPIAPVVTPVLQIKKPLETQNYVVQKGDTMYSIAFLNGVDYRDLAELNNIENPSAIKIGQQLRIPVPVPTKVAEPKLPVVKAATLPGGMKNQPKVGKIPYSEKALAQAEAMQDDSHQEAVPVVSEPAPSVKKDADEEEGVEWGMPTNGRIVTVFSENANRKGVDIAGRRGQAIVASAAGKVVYSGSGLRGYGKLVIIKHNKTFLSAYAHNDLILVKEGQGVTKGQQIAEMGETDSDQVKLHFEIRKFGKPVDPAQYLPLIKP
jgi:lipoprotein NlpD